MLYKIDRELVAISKTDRLDRPTRRLWQSHDNAYQVLLCWLLKTNLAALRCTLSSFLMSVWWGSHTGLAYSTSGRTRVLYACSLIDIDEIFRFLCRKPRVLFASFVMGPTRRLWQSHDNAYQVPHCRIDVRKMSFFPRTVRDWNALPPDKASLDTLENLCPTSILQCGTWWALSWECRRLLIGLSWRWQLVRGRSYDSKSNRPQIKSLYYYVFFNLIW
jgi:hypothetical protein